MMQCTVGFTVKQVLQCAKYDFKLYTNILGTNAKQQNKVNHDNKI
jgi:hypothetical protein